MSKDVKILDEMLEYVQQLKRHTEGRRALHIRMSSLEKHLREEHYRRFAASSLRPLITKFGSTIYALPNVDIVLLTKEAGVDVIDTHLNLIRKELKESALLADLDPVQGESDAFTQWFDLETEYDDFCDYVGKLAEAVRAGVQVPGSKAIDPAPRKPLGQSSRFDDIPASPPNRLSSKMVQIKAPEKNLDAHSYDPQLLMSVSRALETVDITNLLRRQNVMAAVGSAPPQPVMIEKLIPEPLVFETFLEAPVADSNRWLQGYLADFIAEKLLAAKPDMREGNSLAASIRVTCKSIFTPSFTAFDKALTPENKKKVILEFDAVDALSHFGLYQKTQAKLGPEGYRIAITNIDLRALLWLDYKNFQSDFIKLSLPHEPEDDWFTQAVETYLRERVQAIGIARIILTGCRTQEDVSLGQKLGITLYQGDVLSPVQR